MGTKEEKKFKTHLASEKELGNSSYMKEKPGVENVPSFKSWMTSD